MIESTDQYIGLEEHFEIPEQLRSILDEWESMPYKDWLKPRVDIMVLVAKLIPNNTKKCGIHRIPLQEKEIRYKGQYAGFFGKFCPECFELYIEENKMDWLSESLEDHGIEAWIQPVDITLEEWKEKSLPIDFNPNTVIYTLKGLKSNPICPTDEKTTLQSEKFSRKYKDKEHKFSAKYCPECRKIFMGPRAAEDLNLDLGEVGIPQIKIRPYNKKSRNNNSLVYPPDFIIKDGIKSKYKTSLRVSWYPLDRESLVIVGDSKYCGIGDHYTDDSYCLIEVLDRRGSLMRYLVAMGYCEDCKKYFIDRLDFDILLAGGRPLITILNETEENYPVVSGDGFAKEEKHLDEMENLLETRIKEIRSTPWYVEKYATDDEYYGSDLQYDKKRSIPLTEEINSINIMEIRPYGYRTDVRNDDSSIVFYLGPSDIVLYGKKHVISFNSVLGKKLVHYRTRDIVINGKKYAIQRQRTFDIEHKNLYGYTEQSSDDLLFREGITDPFLVSVLNTRKKQHQLIDIISTIQENQNFIVDRPIDKNLIVQGCAGSGKTMVLLHRMSYLKYQHPEYDFSNAIILTPNENFNLHINGMAESLQLGYVKRLSVAAYMLQLLKEYDESFNYKGKILDEMDVNQQYVDFMYSDEFSDSFWKSYNKVMNDIYACCSRVKKMSSDFGRSTRLHYFRPVTLTIKNMIDELNILLSRIRQSKEEQLSLQRKAQTLIDKRRYIIENIEKFEDDYKKAIEAEIEKTSEIINESILERKSKKDEISLKNEEYKREQKNLEHELVSSNLEADKIKEVKKRISTLKGLITRNDGQITIIDGQLKRLYRAKKVYMDTLSFNGKIDFLKSLQDINGKFGSVWNRMKRVKETLDFRQNELKESRLTDQELKNIEGRVNELNRFTSYEKEADEVMEYVESLNARSIFFKVYDDAIKNNLERLQEKTGKPIEERIPGTHRYDLFLQLNFALKFFERPIGENTLIFVDEGQDVIPKTYALIKKANIKTPVFNIFGDVNQLLKQNRGIHDWSQLNDLVPDCELYYLNENYRNTNQIIEYCNERFDMDIKKTGVDGVTVRRINRNDLEESLASLRVGSERIAIILPRTASKTKYINRNKLPDSILSLLGNDIEPGKITIAYVDEIKGVEFDRVYAITNGMGKNEAYIACTRALSELVIVNDPRFYNENKETIEETSQESKKQEPLKPVNAAKTMYVSKVYHLNKNRANS